MATAADVAVLRDANTSLETLALRALRGFWASLDPNRPEMVRDALVEFLPVLTTQYGEVAAVVAADWYDELRAAEAVRGSFAATMAPVVPAEAAVAQVRFGAQHLFTDDPGQTLAFLEGVASKYVLQPGRDTVQQSAAQIRRRWAGTGRPGTVRATSADYWRAAGTCTGSRRSGSPPTDPAIAWVSRRGTWTPLRFRFLPMWRRNARPACPRPSVRSTTPGCASTWPGWTTRPPRHGG